MSNREAYRFYKLPPWAAAEACIVERCARDRDFRTRVLACERTHTEERRKLLDEAKRWAPKLPFGNTG